MFSPDHCGLILKALLKTKKVPELLQILREITIPYLQEVIVNDYIANRLRHCNISDIDIYLQVLDEVNPELLFILHENPQTTRHVKSLIITYMMKELHSTIYNETEMKIMKKILSSNHFENYQHTIMLAYQYHNTWVIDNIRTKLGYKKHMLSHGYIYIENNLHELYKDIPLEQLTTMKINLKKYDVETLNYLHGKGYLKDYTKKFKEHEFDELSTYCQTWFRINRQDLLPEKKETNSRCIIS